MRGASSFAASVSALRRLRRQIDTHGDHAGAEGNYRCYLGAMIRVTATLSLDEDEIEERFIRSPGPGGQNVNKVASAVQLRFDVRRSHSLPAAVRERLERLAGRRLTRDGILVMTAHRHRSQERNRAEALERLAELIRRAAVAPVSRRPTRVPRSTKRERLEAKARRGAIKRLRRAESDD